MTAVPGGAPDDGTVMAGPPRRAPMALFTWAFVLLVLVIVVVLLVVKVTRGTTPTVPAPVAPAPGSVVQAAATVPALVLNTVGAPAPLGPLPVVLSGQPPLLLHGRAGVVYVGSEFCPYCAAVRWALVVALSRFGTFSHLGETVSSPYEAFPELQTFSFDGAAYRSRSVSLSATEEYGPSLTATWPAGFPLLHHPPAVATALMKRYGPATGGVVALPFVDIGNRVLVSGADIGFSPGSLEGVSMAQIGSDLSQPTSPVAEAVLGAANELTAAVCSATHDTPAKVCRSAGVRAGANRLGL